MNEILPRAAGASNLKLFPNWGRSLTGPGFSYGQYNLLRGFSQ
jgi:hypothetical protein